MIVRKIAFLLFLSLSCCFANGQTKWFDPLECDTPYVCGRAWNMEIGKSFVRFPDRFKDKMPRAVWGLSRHSAGLSLRFVTTASEIRVRFTVPNNGRFKNMTPLNHTGVDLFGMEANGTWHWIGNGMNWNYGKEDGDTIYFTFKNIEAPSFKNRGLEYELFLPPYNMVKSMQIGVPEGSSFQFLRESGERPIVVYGSSIVQGASPSRPGLMWTTIVKREMDYPIINLGFSGSALMEYPLFEAMSEIDARVYILDPIPNSHNLGDEILNRAIAGVKKLREKSQAPILFMEMASSTDSVLIPSRHKDFMKGNVMYRKAYNQLKAEGVKGLYYLNYQELGLTEDAMIEGAHPNDIGNMQYAKAVEKKLAEILVEDKADKRYPPVRQRRDGCYEWLNRHNEVIRLNHTTDPEILLIGNSITHFWGGNPVSNTNGGKSWKKLFGKRRVTNMGFGWDRIENVFWRIYHGELEGCHPKHICLLIGINNSGDKEEDIAQGVCNLAKLIRERQPEARLHVLKIYPAKGREEKVARINALIEKNLVIDGQTDLVDLTSALSLPNGKVNPELFLEGLHPNEKGYEAIAKGLKPYLKD